MGSSKATAAAVLSLGVDLGHGSLPSGVSPGKASAGCSGRSLLVCMADGIGPKGLFGHVLLIFFIFFLCSSYLHCKWATLEELEKDPRISQKIKRFRNKQAQMKHIFTEVSAERSKQPCLTPAHRGPVRWTSSPRAGHCLRHLPAQTSPAPGPKLGAGSEQAALTV